MVGSVNYVKMRSFVPPLNQYTSGGQNESVEKVFLMI